MEPKIAERRHEEVSQTMRDLEKLRRFAIERGATEAKIIPANLIEVDPRARVKCMYPPCKWYGSSIMCPPHLWLTPDKTAEIVQRYRYAILIRLVTPPKDLAGPEWTKLHIPHELKLKDIVTQVESAAFNSGYHLALGFGAGECAICLSKGLKCTALGGGACRTPFRARPAMEAAGIDVFTTVRNAGWKIYPIGATVDLANVPVAALYGLVLVV